LPSSLTRDHPRACGSSPCRPVAVSGTECGQLPGPLFSASGGSRLRPDGLALRRLPGVGRTLPVVRAVPRPRPGPLRRCRARIGISTDCPSATPLGLALGPTNPERTILPPEPCGFRRAGFAPAFALLIPAFALRRGPARVPARLRPPADAPLPRRRPAPAVAASVVDLAPSIVGAAGLDQ
jgi:hypothetical protein